MASMKKLSIATVGNQIKANQLITSVLIGLIATAGLTTIAEAGTRRDDRPDSDYINHANNNVFQSVGRLSLGMSNGTGNLCSGTLISSQYVLTAAHCLDDVRAANFILDSNPDNPFSVGWGIRHRRWAVNDRSIDNLFRGYDLAILRLRNSVSGVTPASLYRDRDENGKVGTYVGFGWRGNGTSGSEQGTEGTKRAGDNIIDQSISGISNRILVSDFDNPSTSEALDLEYATAGGDSGGGLFIDGKLAGVNSFVNAIDGNANSSYGDRSASTRVSSHSLWIDANTSWLANLLRQLDPIVDAGGGGTTICLADGYIYIGGRCVLSLENDTSLTSVPYSGQDQYTSDIIFYDDPYIDPEPEHIPEPSTTVGVLFTALLGLASGQLKCKYQQKSQACSLR